MLVVWSVQITATVKQWGRKMRQPFHFVSQVYKRIKVWAFKVVNWRDKAIKMPNNVYGNDWLV